MIFEGEFPVDDWLINVLGLVDFDSYSVVGPCDSLAELFWWRLGPVIIVGVAVLPLVELQCSTMLKN
jgi:hypothetical protein